MSDDAIQPARGQRDLLKWGAIVVLAWLLLRTLRRGFWTLFGLFWAFHWML